MAEAEQLGRPSDGVGGHCASLFNEFLLLDEPAEVLLVDQPACERFNTALQLQQGELGRHQLEYHRAVFDLGAQPRDPGCEDAAMIRRHRLARHDWRLAVMRASGFRDQQRLVQQFVALQHKFFVPVAVIETEGDRAALPALALQRG